MTHTPYRVIAPLADMRGAPDEKALRGKYESQLVSGEVFNVESTENGWCCGHAAHDGYKGYVRADALARADTLPAATHIISAARSHLYAEATMKSPAVDCLSFGSRVAVKKEGEKFMQLDNGAWIYAKHLLPVGDVAEDYIATALKFSDTPYYWGGRSGFGIDCSGLVQVALALAGIAVPRDTEEQASAIGRVHDGAPRTGDIVFFPGHVGIMTDAENILHANAFHMKTCVEPLWMVDERSGGKTAVRRI